MIAILILGLSLVTFSSIDSTVGSRSYDEEVCDPHTMTIDQYPGLLTKLDVVLLNPLKLRAHFRLPNSTKEITAEGMSRGNTVHFSQESAVVACRSLGCSKAAGRTGVRDWAVTQTCRFTCPDGTSALQTCRNMQQNFKCPTDAMSLKECITNPFFTGIPGDNLNGIALVCLECGKD
ncbi:unnamed protein product [Didymodactylos carnosus]|uniref:Uncharacterized protein n=1 Tax=Didymodactylos carnosus TaxID=1234261 RepID=A0A815HII6_9BILA|nr:unnamed protein product [Didymodactylos carnosus]CAF4223993.1 unnamed protein product [Didymodactylos carnosus]